MRKSNFAEVRVLPGTIKSENGGEFVFNVMDKWA